MRTLRAAAITLGLSTGACARPDAPLGYLQYCSHHDPEADPCPSGLTCHKLHGYSVGEECTLPCEGEWDCPNHYPDRVECLEGWCEVPSAFQYQ